MALVLHHSRAKGTDKVILLGIANHSGDGGAWPSIATLARYANVNERAAQKSVARLVASGEVARHLQAGGLGLLHDWQRPNRYDVLVACPATCDRTANHREKAVPKAPADLWKEGVSHRTPGVPEDTRGVSQKTPGGVSHRTPEPSMEPDTHTGRASVTGPREDLAICDICSLPGAQCLDRAAISGHNYKPRKRNPHLRIARLREEYSQ